MPTDREMDSAAVEARVRADLARPLNSTPLLPGVRSAMGPRSTLVAMMLVVVIATAWRCGVVWESGIGAASLSFEECVEVMEGPPQRDRHRAAIEALRRHATRAIELLRADQGGTDPVLRDHANNALGGIHELTRHQ